MTDEPYETDQGTLGLLADLDRDGVNRIKAFLDRCRRHEGGVKETLKVSLHPSNFRTRKDIESVQLERELGSGNRKIVATVDFTSGARWRRGSLRIPNTEIPQTIIIASKGRLIEELVGGAPITGFRITSAVHDRSKAGTTLRLCCTASRTGPIVI